MEFWAESSCGSRIWTGSSSSLHVFELWVARAVDSASKKTITLGRVLAWNIVGMSLAAIYHYATGTSLQTVLITYGIMFVVFNLYTLFAFNVWGVDDEATDGDQKTNGKRSPLKRRLSLCFWAIGLAGAVLFTCFWLFGFIYSLAHSRRPSFRALLPAVFGVLLAGAALKMFREEKNAR